VHSLEVLSAGPLLDEDPPFSEVYHQLGRGYAALGRKSEAIGALEAALRFDPEHAGAKAALAALLQSR
jgi:cytochrome c-type biogenesis protein CcmH/NrfG